MQPQVSTSNALPTSLNQLTSVYKNIEEFGESATLRARTERVTF
jgi:hypothetical protein